MLVIDNPRLVEVLYDPLRSRIMRHLIQPKSVKELAAELRTPPSRLYYHIHLLEEHGLIEIADQQLSRTKLERLYRSRYHSYRLSRQMQNHPSTGSDGALIGNLEDIFDEYLTAVASWEGKGAIQLYTNRHKRLSRDRALEFTRKMQALIDEYFGLDSPEDPDGVVHGQLWMITPFTEMPEAAQFCEEHRDEIAAQVLHGSVRGATDEEIGDFAEMVGGSTNLVGMVLDGWKDLLDPREDCAVGFDLGDGGRWSIRTEAGAASVGRDLDSVEATVRMSPQDFLRMIAREVNLDALIDEGRATVDGDRSAVDSLFAMTGGA